MAPKQSKDNQGASQGASKGAPQAKALGPWRPIKGAVSRAPLFLALFAKTDLPKARPRGNPGPFPYEARQRRRSQGSLYTAQPRREPDNVRESSEPDEKAPGLRSAPAPSWPQSNPRSKPRRIQEAIQGAPKARPRGKPRRSLGPSCTRLPIKGAVSRAASIPGTACKEPDNAARVPNPTTLGIQGAFPYEAHQRRHSQGSLYRAQPKTLHEAQSRGSLHKGLRQKLRPKKEGAFKNLFFPPKQTPPAHLCPFSTSSLPSHFHSPPTSSSHAQQLSLRYHQPFIEKGSVQPRSGERRLRISHQQRGPGAPDPTCAASACAQASQGPAETDPSGARPPAALPKLHLAEALAQVGRRGRGLRGGLLRSPRGERPPPLPGRPASNCRTKLQKYFSKSQRPRRTTQEQRNRDRSSAGKARPALCSDQLAPGKTTATRAVSGRKAGGRASPQLLALRAQAVEHDLLLSTPRSSAARSWLRARGGLGVRAEHLVGQAPGRGDAGAGVQKLFGRPA